MICCTQQSRSFNLYFVFLGYVLGQELPAVVLEEAPMLSADNKGIFGHSMGGHGALICALKNPVCLLFSDFPSV